MFVPTSFFPFFVLLLVVLSSFSLNAEADTRTYQATTDFPVLDSGEVPYYSEAPARASLAINAANESYRDVFARAEVIYDGIESIHDLTLVALAELDGEAEYRILINDELIGTAVNPEVSIDYTVVRHEFPSINVPAGAVLVVESLANTNGKIPEGDGTAYARGRWTALEMVEQSGDETSVPTDIDLSLSLSSSKQTLQTNESFTLDLNLRNETASVTATQPIATLTIPTPTFIVSSADQCTQNNDELICSFPELLSGTDHTLPLSLTATDDILQAAFQGIAQADQTDRDGTNNVANLSLEVVSAAAEPESTDTSNTNTNTIGNSTSSGALSLYWILLLLPLATKVRRRQLNGVSAVHLSG